MTETIDSANAAASTLFLGQNGEWWDFWLIVSLVSVALAAIAAGITTTGSIVSHKRETAAAELELSRYKLETSEKISASTEHIAGLNNDTARLQAENLALQTVLLPRHVGIFSDPDGPPKADTWFAAMAEFDGVSFAVQPVNDPEARSLAGEIVIALAYVGIRASIDEGMTSANPTNVAEGVSVSYPTGDSLLERAGNSLADALTKAGLGVGDWPVFRRGGIPPDPKDIASGLVNPIHRGVVVSVGQRPVSHMVAWINRERSKAAGNAEAPKTDVK